MYVLICGFFTPCSSYLVSFVAEASHRWGLRVRLYIHRLGRTLGVPLLLLLYLVNNNTLLMCRGWNLGASNGLMNFELWLWGPIYYKVHINFSKKEYFSAICTWESFVWARTVEFKILHDSFRSQHPSNTFFPSQWPCETNADGVLHFICHRWLLELPPPPWLIPSASSERCPTPCQPKRASGNDEQ